MKAQSKPTVDLKPRDDAPVRLEIKNVRELVGGGGDDASSGVGGRRPTATASTATSVSSSSSSSPTTAMSSTRASGSGDGSGGSKLDDSLQQLLEDARRMEEERKGLSSSSGVSDALSDEDGTEIKETIRNVLSTIVTADFFVVCGFLLWFLAGIFCRAVFNDDTVQIAFNSKFLQ
jgi:hypothetical protein